MQVHRLTVASIQFTNPQVFLLELQAYAGDPPQPGQFFEFKIGEGFDPLLWRPMSVMDAWSDRLLFLTQLRGRGTQWLAQRSEGDMIEILGPLGRGFPIPEEPVTLVAGGTGVAPLYFLARRHPDRVQKLIAGFATSPGQLLLDRLYALPVPVILTTEDGSLGLPGTVLDVPDLQDRPLVYLCGPGGMIRRFQELGFEGWMSLEDVMGCGTGLCFGCAAWHRKEQRYVRTCVEGPTFPLQDVESLLF